MSEIDPAQALMEPLQRALAAAMTPEEARRRKADRQPTPAERETQLAASSQSRSWADIVGSGAWGAATSPAEHTSGWAGALAG